MSFAAMGCASEAPLGVPHEVGSAGALRSDPPVAPSHVSSSASAGPSSSVAPAGSGVASATLLEEPTPQPGALELPKEPWYHDQPERYEDCVAPMAAPPKPHFPAPFERCDPRETVVNPPPNGHAH